MEVRKVFAATLEKMMRENENIVMLDADLAKAGGTFGLREIFPDRAFDVGIAEANMACVAAGLAAYGFVPFIHSFAPFASRRIFDQIAVSIAYGGNNVKIIGSDPGIAAELNGGTHMSFEDVAAMRAIPGMLIFEPVDARQMEEAMPAIVEYDGPVYVRVQKGNSRRVHRAGLQIQSVQSGRVEGGDGRKHFRDGTFDVGRAARRGYAARRGRVRGGNQYPHLEARGQAGGFEIGKKDGQGVDG